MQFIPNGPDIPDALLQAHEEGRVVFFCGAGVSYPAGLPSFDKLVNQLYEFCATKRNASESDVYERKQYDTVLDLLERRLPGKRAELRGALFHALKPKLRRKSATDTHAALLRLARTSDGTLRLVTTNFDRVFHAAARRSKQPFQEYAAPMLPVPKNSRWDGLVYLHGLLPERHDETSLNRLVLTSGDFGLAYLTERWAARFVSELFRNYVVCFVGYSINDSVLRYMMDALAADRMLGEVTPQAWALADYSYGQKEQKLTEWKAKGVTPVLYEAPPGKGGHSALHKTLRAWAETYRDGVGGKEAIVVSHALARPSTSTPQDDFVGRMLWALSDKSGLPAKRFAELNPVPPLDWLFDAFSDDRFKHADLVRFGVPSREIVDERLRFSLIRRAAPYDLAPDMQLVSSALSPSGWDKVMYELARWLTRHLGDPRLIVWVAQRGGRIHDSLRRLIERELDRPASPEQDGRTADVAETGSRAPSTILSPSARTLWRLLLSGRLKSGHDHDLYSWLSRLKRDGLTPTLRFQLRERLAPQVSLRAPFRRTAEGEAQDKPQRIDELVDWELVLATDDARSALRSLSGEQWAPVLRQLLDDFQQLLRDALDLQKELDGANDREGSSHLELPSVSPHWQNQRIRDWACLIELVRDAWLAVQVDDGPRARRIAEAWFELPYPTFKRLALFAATSDPGIGPDSWVGWLLADDTRWLWFLGTKREVLRLLALQGRTLAGPSQVSLEAAILNGPAPEMYRDVARREYAVWLRLTKLALSRLTLGTAAKARLDELSATHPEWQPAPDERDEFSVWMSGTGDPDLEDGRTIYEAPAEHLNLVRWLMNPPPLGPFDKDTWRDDCRKHFARTLCALCELGLNGLWPTQRWQDALYAWGDERIARRSWRHAAPRVQNMPDEVLRETLHGLTWWLQSASRSIDRHENILLSLCLRVLAISGGLAETPRSTATPAQPVADAINHPVGHVTQALLNLWFKKNPNDDDHLPAEIEPLFTRLCDAQIEPLRHGRLLLGTQLIALFRVDPIWTKAHLLPLLSWDNPAEAKAVWEGFLWSPRLHAPLLVAVKAEFLKCANHYADLDDLQEQFASFLTYAALELPEGFTQQEFRTAFEALPPEGLAESARALAQILDGAADRRAEYWTNRVLPFWKNVWPNDGNRASPQVAESLVQLIIAADSGFPAAIQAVKYWLRPIAHPGYILHLLHESKLCAAFPADALTLLHAVIPESLHGRQGELEACLQSIGDAAPQLAQDSRYRRLRDRARSS